MKRFLASVFAVGLALALSTPVFAAETAGEKVDRGVEKTKDTAKDTGETIKDKTKHAGEEVKVKTEEAWDKTKEKTHEVKDKVTHKTNDHHPSSMTRAGANDVMSMQQALKDKGQDPGPIDGRMGPRTRAALESYQKAEGLKATGRLDSETRTRLGMASSTAVSPSASPSTASDTRGDANVTSPNTPASTNEKGVTSTKKQQP